MIAKLSNIGLRVDLDDFKGIDRSCGIPWMDDIRLGHYPDEKYLG